MNTPIRIDIWSDIACPWCYVGKRRLERALVLFKKNVQIEYHSFELVPDTPTDYPGSQADFLAEYKGIPVAQAKRILAQITQAAAAEGLAFDYDALRPANTSLAHQALHFAKMRGRQGALKERLLEAYFVQGCNLNVVEVIADLCGEIGLDSGDLLAALRNRTHLSDVRADHAQAVGYGITGVPFFVFNNKLAVSGAQLPDVFHEALQRAESSSPEAV
ncbi:MULTISPECIES: DsbA family protein [unclassified Burkholderia]|uniref:DsbA family oxidoreductase n=1 Tax=unclassified Burkholderia TaxID=2613784 RepID=UPI000F57ADA4|nr:MULTISPECIES: DsbA family oxidoreductase [unclassified Burkholderia]RQS26864.1 DsbA family oxidoreductase [Burkholderia sp. Bp8995]RQS51750.1 DsbA family oxidoreductase [Burkholderia sp. Bp8989]